MTIHDTLSALAAKWRQYAAENVKLSTLSRIRAEAAASAAIWSEAASQLGEVEITAMAACVCPSSPCAVHPMAATRGNRSDPSRAAAEPDEHRRSIIRENAAKNPAYNPYCMRCPGLKRMTRVEPMFWQCDMCKAEHDEREPRSAAEPTKAPERMHVCRYRDGGTALTLPEGVPNALLADWNANYVRADVVAQPSRVEGKTKLHECASSDCANTATSFFLSGDVGSWYCADCHAKVMRLVEPAPSAPKAPEAPERVTLFARRVFAAGRAEGARWWTEPELAEEGWTYADLHDNFDAVSYTRSDISVPIPPTPEHRMVRASELDEAVRILAELVIAPLGPGSDYMVHHAKAVAFLAGREKKA